MSLRHRPHLQEPTNLERSMCVDYTPLHHAQKGMKCSRNSNGAAVTEGMKELQEHPSSLPQQQQQRCERQQPQQQRTVPRNSHPHRNRTGLAGEDVFAELCSYDNLELAFQKAKKRKSSKQYVIEFEENLESNVLQLRHELLFHIYRPQALKIFVLRDPKTRVIGKSHFRDRVIHHAICNIIEPMFQKSFIHDSFANQNGKGTLKAHQRFDHFKRKVSKNNTRTCYVLKADIRHYFDTVDHNILLRILAKKVTDSRVMHLIKVILANHKTKIQGKGMPLGNLTSQFFANVYLNELDQFVKHELKATNYIRYVDDFVILHHDKGLLESYKAAIDRFLTEKLKLLLHPNKSHVLNLKHGIPFLGFRVFYHHKLLRPMNRRKFEKKLATFKALYEEGLIEREDIDNSLAGWNGYAMWANTYTYRTNVLKQIDSWEVALS